MRCSNWKTQVHVCDAPPTFLVSDTLALGRWRGCQSEAWWSPRCRLRRPRRGPWRRELPALALGDSDALRQGDEVLALGYPLSNVLGAELSATRGIVSRPRVNLSGAYTTDVIQMDANLNPGNSGGPLLDSNGKVVGVNFASLRNVQGVFFAVPINAARALLASTG
jgi:S1-C subfamily serine protease